MVTKLSDLIRLLRRHHERHGDTTVVSAHDGVSGEVEVFRDKAGRLVVDAEGGMWREGNEHPDDLPGARPEPG
jgi:hypothetical protein